MKIKKRLILITVLFFVICCAISVLFQPKWSSINTIVDNNANWISTVTGVISVILSGFAVYYGRKAYIVAQEIFEKGISLNKEKVVDQLGLEFVVDIFIPLSKLIKNIDGCLERYEGNPPVSEIYTILKNNRLPNTFIYYDSHKSEIWYSLTICKNQEKAFGKIRSFVYEALRFQNTLDDSISGLKRNLNGSNKHIKLKDLYQRSSNTKKRINYLRETANKITDFESRLPKELGIAEKKRKIYRDYI